MTTAARVATVALLIAACTSSPAVSPAASPSVTPTATVAAASPTAAGPPPGTFENKVLGYRITLPLTYRLANSSIYRGQPELLGQDTYTTTTEAQDRAECLKDGGDMPSLSAGALLIVWAYRNPARLSPADWVRRRPEATLHTVEPDTVNGLDAVRLVQQGETQMYVIRATDRMYELSPTLWPSQHPLATIAASFAPVEAQSFPTPTPAPSESPREAAGTSARTLAAAFAARDAEAVAGLMPSCRFAFSSIVGATPGGIVNRSIVLFTDALRTRFAAGDLRVAVDPAVQIDTGRGGLSLFVRSSWIELDRTTAVDLFLREIDGRWLWTEALHHYQSLDPRSCIPYRSPWITPTPGGPCS